MVLLPQVTSLSRGGRPRAAGRAGRCRAFGRPWQRVNNGDALREAAIAGNGIAVPPASIPNRTIESGLLVPLLKQYEQKPVDMYEVYPSRRYLPRKVRAFVDFLLRRFGDRQYWDEQVFKVA